MYKIDVPTYHWDNDRFEIETKVSRFDDMDKARKFQAWLWSRHYDNDSLLCHPSVSLGVRNSRTHEIPQHNSMSRRKVYDKIDVHHGVIIESTFDIYTEKVIRTKIGT